jgi:chromosomal replication initiation ATPase DnaA
MKRRRTGGTQANRAGPEDARPAARLSLAVRLVAATSGVASEAMVSAHRHCARTSAARQLAMYLAHTSFGWPLSAVGDCFGRDRTTARHACRRVEERRDDPAFDAALVEIERLLALTAEATP